MQAFPGSFPPDVFDRLDLNRYAEAYDMAVDLLNAQADAIKSARR